MEVTITEVHNRLSHWLKKLSAEESITITQWGKPVAVLISAQEYERLSQVRAYLEMVRLSQALQDAGVTAHELFEASRTELEARQ